MNNTKTLYNGHVRVLSVRVESWSEKNSTATAYIAFAIDFDKNYHVMIGKMKIDTASNGALFEIEKMATYHELVKIEYTLHNNGAVIRNIGGYTGL